MINEDDFLGKIINGHKIEVCAGGQLRVKEGWIWIEKKKCCICQEDKVCLGFDTSAAEYGQIDICYTCVNALFFESHNLTPENLQKEYAEYESKIKYDSHGNRIIEKEDNVQEK
mgnify:CR=1 FL=1